MAAASDPEDAWLVWCTGRSFFSPLEGPFCCFFTAEPAWPRNRNIHAFQTKRATASQLHLKIQCFHHVQSAFHWWTFLSFLSGIWITLLWHISKQVDCPRMIQDWHGLFQLEWAVLQTDSTTQRSPAFTCRRYLDRDAPRFGELSKLLPVFLVVVTIVFLYVQYLCQYSANQNWCVKLGLYYLLRVRGIFWKPTKQIRWPFKRKIMGT